MIDLTIKEKILILFLCITNKFLSSINLPDITRKWYKVEKLSNFGNRLDIFVNHNLISNYFMFGKASTLT